ncbi:S41 family peptidase [Pseudoduganella sp. SL102]|uniref:S41 family peptidase n=1 Tax=Pseudoduganella sp. SL102 TaxID=2995154 RepID=UPI00248B50AF|nr:S41 family peptidase [Pseudoduganella sp. SL102]WBS02259.1 S41 family peptidase [Pseudoduganella sp. SL102]
MKKKWIVIPSLLVLAVVGVVAAAGATQPMWRPLWERVNPPPKVVVDRAMRTKALDTLVAKLNENYIFPDKAKEIEKVLRQRQQEGKYDGITEGEQLARQLTEDIHGVVKDLHMAVVSSPGMVPPDDALGPPPSTRAEWEERAPLPMRLFARVSDLGVEKVDHLGPRVGYLKLSAFHPHFLVEEKFAAAMDKLADTDGLIIDLRENGGGAPDSVALLVSYFVDGRTRLNDIWDRKTGVAKQFWSVDKPGGKRYGGKKPVMILAGPGTMSAGEDFAYTMQALKRATVIGERTWGGAHPARPYRLGDHFFAVIPDARSISPITRSNWEGTGVIPDIPAAPDKALAMAEDLLRRRLQGSAPLAAAGH